MMAYRVCGLESMRRFGAHVASVLQSGDTLFLAGALGAGKTTLAQCIIRVLCGEDVEVTSPTFTLQHPYDLPAGGTLMHMDMYRIEDAAELDMLGLDEMIGMHLCLIEWPEKLAHHTPNDYVALHLVVARDGARLVQLSSAGRGALLQEKLNDAIIASGEYRVA